jgi:hypothetical protein
LKSFTDLNSEPQPPGLYVRQGAPWFADLRAELLSFPAGKHDDQVDALGLVGQLLDKIKRSLGLAACSLRSRAARTMLSSTEFDQNESALNRCESPLAQFFSSSRAALEWHSRGQGFDSPWLHQCSQWLERLKGLWFKVIDEP